MIERLSPFLLASLPLVLFTAGWWCGRTPSVLTTPSLRRLNRTVMALLVTLITLAFTARTFLMTSSLGQNTLASSTVASSNLTYIMLTLIAFMSGIIMKFSTQYMSGDTQEKTYWRWLLNVLASVTLVVISNHLILFWVGWVAISLSLNHLLTLYPNRHRAMLAAHKKFMLARTAEALFLSAIIILYITHETFLITELVANFNALGENPAASISTTDQIAAVLLAITALIKSAQLPVHGWLIKVVETPTPISALLHAGVINLGGFLLILFGPLLIQAIYAQWLVLLIAGLSTLLCSLIMTTRISVKVHLAWSTSAQMGLMLIECALGLFDLALLHLIAHSAYKAHAFLNSGSRVYEELQQRLAPPIKNPSLEYWVLGSCIAIGLTTIAKTAFDTEGVWAMWVLMALALTSLVSKGLARGLQTHLTATLGLAFLVVASYVIFKNLFGLVLPDLPWTAQVPLSLMDVWAILIFVSLFLLNAVLRFKASHPFVKRLSYLLFSGLYIDEWLTRILLKIWPVTVKINP